MSDAEPSIEPEEASAKTTPPSEVEQILDGLNTLAIGLNGLSPDDVNLVLTKLGEMMHALTEALGNSSN